MVVCGALVGANGAGLIFFRTPARVYVMLAGIVWVLLWTAFLAGVALRDHRS